MAKRGGVGVKESSSGKILRWRQRGRERERGLLLEQVNGTAKLHIYVKPLVISLKQNVLINIKHTSML
jgi:hypothetical protein